MSDTIKMRRPVFAVDGDDPSGYVSHDDRGNAIWKWAERAGRTLEIPPLQLIDEEPPPAVGAKLNKVAKKSGYDPYESGLIVDKGPPKRRDLRELSKWIELKRRCAAGAADDAAD